MHQNQLQQVSHNLCACTHAKRVSVVVYISHAFAYIMALYPVNFQQQNECTGLHIHIHANNNLGTIITTVLLVPNLPSSDTNLAALSGVVGWSPYPPLLTHSLLELRLSSILTSLAAWDKRFSWKKRETSFSFTYLLHFSVVWDKNFHVIISYKLAQRKLGYYEGA